MAAPEHQEQVYSIDPARLPRHRFFQKRLQDIHPRMKRIIEHEHGQSCQTSIKRICLRIKDMSQPPIRLITYGDRDDRPIQKILHLRTLGDDTDRLTYSDISSPVVVIWISAVQDKRIRDRILTECVVPKLKPCYSRRSSDLEQMTPVIICIEHEGRLSDKEFKTGIINCIKAAKEFNSIKMTKEQEADLDSRIVILTARKRAFNQDAKELKREKDGHCEDKTTAKTRYKSKSPTRRTRTSSGTAKSSPPQVFERMNSPMQIDSTDENMEIDPVQDSRVEQSSLSPRPTTRSMTIKKGSDQEANECLGHSPTTVQPVTESGSQSPSRRTRNSSGAAKHSPPKTFEMVHSPMQTENTDDHMEIDPPAQDSGVKQSSLSHRPTTRSMTTQKGSDQEGKEYLGHSPTGVQPATEHSFYDVNDETVLLDAISYQLETIHIHTLKMIEKLVSEMNNKPKHETEVMSTMDKLLFEVNGVFYQSTTKEGENRREEAEKKKLSKQLTGDLLRLQHVYGCGRLYGKLHVHIDKTDDQASVRQRIERVLKQHKYQYAYEMKPILEKPTRFDRSHRASVLICSA